MSPVTGVPEAELASENRLPNVALDLKHLRTTLRLAVELENEPRVGLCLHIQVELRGRALGFFPDANPAVVENGASPRRRSRQIQRHRHLPDKLPGADPAGGASPAGVDRDLHGEFPGKDVLPGEPLDVGLAQVKRGRYGLNVAVRELVLRRDERNDSGLERKVLKPDFAKARRRRRMNDGASRLRRHRDLEGKIPNGEAHERAGIHGAPLRVKSGSFRSV